jgi:prepilin-type N-terminal cleavage/methylation domain-containing protein
MKDIKGFTLIELLVVVLIIGILAAIALPQYWKSVEKSRAVEAVITMKALLEAVKMYHLQTGSHTYDITQLDIEIPGANVVLSPYTDKKSKYFKYRIAGEITNPRIEAEHTSSTYRLTLRNDGLFCMIYDKEKNPKRCSYFGKATLNDYQFDCHGNCYKIEL